MQLYLARATQVMDLEAHLPHICLNNIGTLHANLEDAKRALATALMREARNLIKGSMELNILWDEPTKARCVVSSFDQNGNLGLWMEAASGQINEMRVSP